MNCWIALCSMGPRQISGRSPGLRNPIDISRTPYFLSGMMRSSRTSGMSWIPIINGTLGP